MPDRVQNLGSRVADAWRKSAANQSLAYREYGALLDRYAQKDIGVVEFGRNSFDLYVNAGLDAVSLSARLAGDLVEEGLRVVGVERARSGGIDEDVDLESMAESETP